MKKLMLIAIMLVGLTTQAQQFNKLNIDGVKFMGKAYSEVKITGKIFTLSFDNKHLKQYDQKFIVELVDEGLYMVKGSDKIITVGEDFVEITGVTSHMVTLGGVRNSTGVLRVWRK